MYMSSEGWENDANPVILENDPVTGYTKSRTAIDKFGYEQIRERFAGEPSYERTTTLFRIGQESLLKTTEVSRYFGNSGVGMRLDYELDEHTGKGAYEFIYSHYQKNSTSHHFTHGVLIGETTYDENGNFRALQAFPLSRRILNSQGFAFPINEEVIQHDGMRVKSFYDEYFTIQLHPGGDVVSMLYDTTFRFNPLERHFNVVKLGDNVLVQQCLFVPHSSLLYSFLVPLKIQREYTDIREDLETGGWRLVIDNVYKNTLHIS